VALNLSGIWEEPNCCCAHQHDFTWSYLNFQDDFDQGIALLPKRNFTSRVPLHDLHEHYLIVIFKKRDCGDITALLLCRRRISASIYWKCPPHFDFVLILWACFENFLHFHRYSWLWCGILHSLFLVVRILIISACDHVRISCHIHHVRIAHHISTCEGNIVDTLTTVLYVKKQCWFIINLLICYSIYTETEENSTKSYAKTMAHHPVELY